MQRQIVPSQDSHLIINMTFMKNPISLIIVLCFVFLADVSAQYYNPEAGCITRKNPSGFDECLPNVILSAVPFLRIVPDARGGGMGDAGIASSADPNAHHFNSSKLAFAEKDMSFSVTYLPWLRNLGLKDVYMGYVTGYKKVDDLQTLGMSFRFFDLGAIQFTDSNGNPIGEGSPREFEFGISYNRKLGTNFAAGLTTKFIYSNLASGQFAQGAEISSATAFAADLSLTYKKPGKLTEYGSLWTFGGAITNIGSKITYTRSQNKDFIPMNLGLGASLLLNFDEYNSITFLVDVNKLLLPTPISPRILDEDGNPVLDSNGNEIIVADYDANNNSFPDYKEQSIFSAAVGSFGDAQGGFGEEIKEFNYSIGVEYWYSQQFAVRTGYYFENPIKGDRQFLTAGVGLKYSVFAIDLSYLIPTNNRRNPLDNTLRFTLQFDFAALSGDY